VLVEKGFSFENSIMSLHTPCMSSYITCGTMDRGRMIHCPEKGLCQWEISSLVSMGKYHFQTIKECKDYRLSTK
jgi:hypothetical protein